MFKAKCLLVLALSVPLFYEVYREGKSLASPSKFGDPPTFEKGIGTAKTAVDELKEMKDTKGPYSNLGQEAFQAALRVSDDPDAVNEAKPPADVTVKNYGKALREARAFVTAYATLKPGEPLPNTIQNEKYQKILRDKQKNVEAEQVIRTALREEPWKENKAAREKLDGLVAKYKEPSSFNSSFVDAVDAVLEQDRLEKRLIELKNRVLNSGFNAPPAGSGGAATPRGGLEGEVERVIQDLRAYKASYKDLRDPRGGTATMGQWADDQLQEWDLFNRFLKLQGAGTPAELAAVLRGYESLCKDARNAGKPNTIALAALVRRKANRICEQFLPVKIPYDSEVFYYPPPENRKKTCKRAEITVVFKKVHNMTNKVLNKDEPAELTIDKETIDYLQHENTDGTATCGDSRFLEPTNYTRAADAYNKARNALSDASKNDTWTQADLAAFAKTAAPVDAAPIDTEPRLKELWAKINAFVGTAKLCPTLFP